MSATIRRTPLSEIARSLNQNAARLQLGPTLRYLARALNTDDPLAGGERDRATVRISQFDGLCPYLGAEVTEVLEGSDFVVVTTPILSWLGTNGVLPYDASSALMASNDYETVREEMDRVTHRLVAAWYGHWLRSRTVDPPSSSNRSSLLQLEFDLARATGVPVRAELAGAWVRTNTGKVPHDPTRTVRIVLGPMPGSRAVEFVPGGAAHRQLLAAARCRLDPLLEIELEILAEQPLPLARPDVGDRYDSGAVFASDSPARGTVTLRVDRRTCALAREGAPWRP